MRITIACPEVMVADANQFAMAVGDGPADANTYRENFWYDAEANAYSAASFTADQSWIDSLAGEVTRPAWDSESTIDMAAANRAKDALTLYSPEEGGSASVGAIVGIYGIAGPAALELLGLTKDKPELPEDIEE